MFKNQDGTAKLDKYELRALYKVYTGLMIADDIVKDENIHEGLRLLHKMLYGSEL